MAGQLWLTGYPGFELAITTTRDTQIIQQDEDMIGLPSISADGELVGSFREAAADKPEAHHPVIVAAYSVRKKSWRLYSTPIPDIGQAAVSPNHAALAYAVRNSDSSRSIELHIIDTESASELQKILVGHDDLFSLSWSPDGARLAYDTYPTHATTSFLERIPTIYVMDLRTGAARKIAMGLNPSWSPSSEWIAYFDQTAGAGEYNRVHLIKPDGTNDSTLLTLGKWHFLLFSGQRCFRFPPVWSPDSGLLLLNEYTNAEKFTFDLQMVDISKSEMKRVAKGKPPVLGWISLSAE